MQFCIVQWFGLTHIVARDREEELLRIKDSGIGSPFPRLVSKADSEASKHGLAGRCGVMFLLMQGVWGRSQPTPPASN